MGGGWESGRDLRLFARLPQKSESRVNYLDPGWLRTDLGGENAMFEVTTVLPGALVPALLDDDGPSGRFFAAQDFKDLE